MLDSQPAQHVVQNPDDSPIFVIGTGRSGTTLLRQMLNAHPRIHVTHEAGFYSYGRHATGHTTATEWLERYFETFSFAWLHLDPQEVRDELPREVPLEQMGLVHRAIMRCKARQQGKPRYGEKNPLDTHNLERIFADFADPRIVCIMRDPRPTVSSFNRMPFGTPSKLLNSFLCQVQFTHIQPYLDRILEVRLEDLVADPRAAMQAILRYIGEPWDEAVLDHVRRSAVDDVPPLPWFVGATREQPSRDQSEGSDGRRGGDPAWIRLIERINRRAMERYGYQPAHLEREPGWFDFARAVARDIPGIVSATYRLLSLKGKIDRHFLGQERLDPQQGMEENVRLNPAAWRYYPDFRMPLVPQLPARRPV